MTAQTGKDAGKRWRSYVEDIPDVEDSGVTVMRGKGAERLTYDKTGSYLEPFPPTDAAIHGDAGDTEGTQDPTPPRHNKSLPAAVETVQ